MQAYLIIKSLFKTIEYKLVDSDSLEMTELSMSGVKSKKVLLSSLNLEDGQSMPTFISWLILFLGSSSIVSIIYFSQFSTLLQNNLMNAVFFLANITIALAFICKSVKTLNYRDVYSNNVLLKLNKDVTINPATDQFVSTLNAGIKSAKEEESNKINLKKNIKLQYEMHNKNVDDLFNLDLIDEALYNRIRNSIHEKVFGKLTEKNISNNVIYLNR